MKTLKSLLAATAAVLAFSSAAFALPPGKDGSELTTKAQFTELNAGDKVTLVCKMHGPQKEITIKDSKMAMELCEESHKAHCGDGQGIHWPELDEDLSMEGMLQGRPSFESQKSFQKWVTERKKKGLTSRCT